MALRPKRWHVADHYSDYVDFYDLEYSNRLEALDTVAAWAEAGPALEVGCGTGRLLFPLAERGVRVWGLELSAPMLEVARAKHSLAEPEVRERVTLVEGDMRNFDLSPQSFELIYLPYNEIMHLSTCEDQLAALRQFRRHLRPTGALLFTCVDLSGAAAENPGMAPQVRRRPDFDFVSPQGPVCVSSLVWYDSLSQVARQERFYDRYEEGRLVERRKVELSYRWFTAFELEHLLARAGFRIAGFWAGYAGLEYFPPGEMLVVAQPMSMEERVRDLQRELDDVRDWLG